MALLPNKTQITNTKGRTQKKRLHYLSPTHPHILPGPRAPGPHHHLKLSLTRYADLAVNFPLFRERRDGCRAVPIPVPSPVCGPPSSRRSGVYGEGDRVGGGAGAEVVHPRLEALLPRVEVHGRKAAVVRGFHEEVHALLGEKGRRSGSAE